MPIIDFHNHFYPPEYLAAVQEGPSNVRVTIDDEDNPVLHYPGDYNVIVPGHRIIEFRQSVLDEAGVDKQVLTFTSPGTHIESPDRSVPLARMVNDAFAEIVAQRSDRFTALATLPLNNVEATLAEFDRATDELGFAGFMLFSNVGGTALADESYWPLYERASDKGTVLYIHPIDPVGVEAMTEYWLMPLIGFTFDTTLAAAHLVFAGVPERYPGIRWALGHLGGAIPYLAERLDRGFYAFDECRANIDKPPSEYLKKFYYDTVNFDPKALQLAIDFAGTSQILAGSDYPHKIGNLEMMISSINELDLSDVERTAILGGNAARLLGL
ncbi:MAG: amidohydrolase [Acidobacteria bacterium]|nr:amidohydrolase [Acidobacteriota bacterium]